MRSTSAARPLLSDKDDSSYLEPEEEQNSPYPEVRASVPNTDDSTSPQNTLRMWILAFVSCTIFGVLNLMLSMQANAFAVGPHIVTIAVWPVGKLWEYMVPRKTIFGFQLNPGPFNIKEHALITIMATCALGEGPTYVTDLVAVKRYILGEKMSVGYIILLIFSTQLIGLALAGMVRRILIYPAAFIFPNSLVGVTLLTNLHIKSNYLANGWRISRLRLLWWLMFAGALYQWVPTFLGQFMSLFSWASWIAPNNVVVNQFFGANSGLSLLPFCFDWSSISGYLGSPLVPPLGTLINTAGCVVVFFWIVVPIVSFRNVWFGDYLPIVSSSGTIFDRYQNQYDVDKVMDGNDFNEAKYKAYSPIFMSDSNAVAYGLSFAAVTATFVHSALFDFGKILKYWKTSSENTDDLHMKLMKKYPEIHFLVYLVIFVLCVVLFVVVAVVYSNLGVGPLFLAVAIASVMFIPAGFLFATTNIQLGLNVISEMIIGYLQQGYAEANILFKIFCYYPHLMGLVYLENMKTGHYLKLNPRYVFCVQVVGALWGGIVQWLTLEWAGHHFKRMCSSDQPQGFTCSLPQVFYQAAIIWGTIGPQRVLKIYRAIMYFFVIGAVLPLLSWLWLRKNPRSSLSNIHWPVFFNAASLMPPASPYNYVTYLQAGFLFTYYVRRRYFNWWAKYNYTVSAGLELAVILGQLVIIIVQLIWPSVTRPNWWGNVGAFNNVDSNSVPRVVLEPGQAFGPATW